MSETHPAAPVLLVDDEENILRSTEIILAMAGINNTILCQDSREVKSLLAQSEYAAVSLDLSMPHISGQELLAHMTHDYPGTPVIVVTGANELETAVDCMKLGAFDYLLKPVDKTRLVTSVRHAIEHWEIRNENSLLKERFLSDRVENPAAFSEVITRSSSMQSIFRYVEAIAGTSLPVLITGETGVGKELLARAIHAVSARAGAFVAVNVAGLDDTLFADTLFGHVRGAFTGATSDRDGMIGKASAGTLFLDEIGDLAGESQIKLLRLLQEREYQPLGSDRPHPTNARFVFATNHDLREGTETGRFRKDLYYRLRSHQIRIPPLRERREDIPLLLDHFLEKASGEVGKKRPTPPKELYSLLKVHDFPGNIRELEGLVYDAVVRHESGVLAMSHFTEALDVDVPESGGGGRSHPLVEEGGLFTSLETLPSVEEVVRTLVEESLKRSDGNQTTAARIIGMNRTTLNKHRKRRQG